jgi:hypothetical protein
MAGLTATVPIVPTLFGCVTVCTCLFVPFIRRPLTHLCDVCHIIYVVSVALST